MADYPKHATLRLGDARRRMKTAVLNVIGAELTGGQYTPNYLEMSRMAKELAEAQEAFDDDMRQRREDNPHLYVEEV